jgi:hypothetical protein
VPSSSGQGLAALLDPEDEGTMILPTSGGSQPTKLCKIPGDLNPHFV